MLKHEVFASTTTDHHVFCKQ